MEDSEAEKAANIIFRHARPPSDQAGGQIALLEEAPPVAQAELSAWSFWLNLWPAARQGTTPNLAFIWDWP